MKTVAEIHCTQEAAPDWETNLVANNCAIHVHKFAINEFVYLIDKNPELITTSVLEKSSRFYHREDAQRYLLARIICRLLLAAYNDLDPSTIVFQKGSFEKPYIKNENQLQIPYFNWSHAHNLLVVAISTLEVGIDVEQIRDFDFESVAAATFTNAEQKFLSTSEKNPEDFFMLWTRKEAVVKATGIGLNDELKQFQVLDGKNQLEDSRAHAGVVLQNCSLITEDEYMLSICSLSEKIPVIRYIALPSRYWDI